MKAAARWSLILIVVIAGAFIGRWWGNSSVEPESAPDQRLTERQARFRTPERPFDGKLAHRDDEGFRMDQTALKKGALPNQRVLRFSSRAALEAFLRSIEGKGFVVLGSIDALNLLRIGFLDEDELAGLLSEDTEQEFIFPAYVPGNGTVQEGAIGFGNNFLQWLGADGDRTGWGEGLRIAVLDTGVGDNDQFSNSIVRKELVELPENSSDLNGHGTAVASIIASELGLAPDATILSYRVADDGGSSNTFLIAQAIIEAADAGADLINISLGTSSHSPTLQQAVDYASDAGVVIVASSGNNGADSVAYPAAYENVVSVGAVDAKGDHLDFSNSGEVDLTAPGLALTSAWTDNQQVNFSGTSASAPVVTGAIAAVMTTNQVGATTAVGILTGQANDGGAPGYDPAYGAGYVDLGRAQRPATEPFTDVAIASNHFTTNEQGQPMVQVTIENRGTTQIINAPVTVNTPSGTQQMNITSLQPGAIQTFELPLPNTTDTVRVDSTVRVSNGGADQNVSNNSRTDVQAAAESP